MADSSKNMLDMKEKELLALEQKLNARESVSLGTTLSLHSSLQYNVMQSFVYGDTI